MAATQTKPRVKLRHDEKSYKPKAREYNPEDHRDDGGTLEPGPGRESFQIAQFWKQQVETWQQYARPWRDRGNNVLKRYRDERGKYERGGMRRMNLLWANTKIMKPAIYSRCPDPIVERKFLDKDPVGRLSSVILERGIRAQLEHGYHAAMNKAVYDRLLPGRGQVWVRYEPVIGEDKESLSIKSQSASSMEDSFVKIAKDVGDKDILEETAEEAELDNTGDVLLTEKVVTDYVDWRDFMTFPVRARTWEEVQAVGKCVFMSKYEAELRFGKEIAQNMKPDTEPETTANGRTTITDNTIFRDTNERSIVVYEIWNKSDKRVYWVSSGYEYLCDVREDPYKLKEFFPCPEPLNATLTNDSLLPVADYYQYQDQAIQIDELTQRIAMLTKACKVAGAYNAANKALARIFDEAIENQLIPVDQWAMFAESGGVKGAIDLLPLDTIESCIKTLREVRQECMQDLDQVTGISDIVRGTTDSRETLGGIRLKNNNAGTRLSEQQNEVQRFCRDTIEIIGQLVAKHFDDETLVECSGVLFDDEMQPESVLREYEPDMPGFQVDKSKLQQQGRAPLSPQAPQQPNQAQSQGVAPPMPASGGVGKGPSPQSIPPVGPTNVVPFPLVGDPNVIAQQNATPVPPADALIIEKLEKALNLLRQDVSRNYRISIETDSTIFGDKVQERQDASDFVEAIGGFMANFERLGQAVPEAMPLLARTLQWACRKFRIGRDLESEINSFVARMEKKAKQLIENPQPTPEDKKLQNAKEIKQMELDGNRELESIKAQAQEQNDMREAQIQAANDERDAQKQAAEDEREAQLMQIEVAQKQRESEINIRMKEMEMQFKEKELALKLRMMEAQMQMKEHDHALNQQNTEHQAGVDMQAREHEHALNKDMAETTHQHTMEEGYAQHSNKMQQSEVAAKSTAQKAELQEKGHEQKKEIMDHTAEHKKKQLQMQAKNKGKK